MAKTPYYLACFAKTLEEDLRNGNLEPQWFLERGLSELVDRARSLVRGRIRTGDSYDSDETYQSMATKYADMIDFIGSTGEDTTEHNIRFQLLITGERAYLGESSADREIAKISAGMEREEISVFLALERCIEFMDKLRAQGLHGNEKGDLKEDFFKVNDFYLVLREGISDKRVYESFESKRREIFEDCCLRGDAMQGSRGINFLRESLDFDLERGDVLDVKRKRLSNHSRDFKKEVEKLESLRCEMKRRFFNLKGDVEGNPGYEEVLETYQRVYDLVAGLVPSAGVDFEYNPTSAFRNEFDLGADRLNVLEEAFLADLDEENVEI
jgi:hypothetical protein